jgi:hypothetical protein
MTEFTATLENFEFVVEKGSSLTQLFGRWKRNGSKVEGANISSTTL